MVLSRARIASASIALLTFGLACCGPSRVSVDKTWIEGEQICFLISVSASPPGADERVTVAVTGGGGALEKKSIVAKSGSTHKICVTVPGSMPGPGTTLTANVFGSDPADPEPRPRPDASRPGREKRQWDKDSKTWEKHTPVNAEPLGDLPRAPPALPTGTIED